MERVLGGSFRGGPGLSPGISGSCDAAHHTADHGKLHEGSLRARQVLKVLGQPPTPTEPAKGPLDDPAMAAVGLASLPASSRACW
jgi:hypothetical protein